MDQRNKKVFDEVTVVGPELGAFEESVIVGFVCFVH